jgi:peptidoglycan/LPS O-acetylase OafA/YrhL
MAPAAAAHKHISRLDVLRAVAFLMVLAVHFCAVHQWFLPSKGQFPDYPAWPVWTYPLVPFTWGMYGVSLFFVISGYCIHLSFARNPAAFEWKGFFWRRLLRLYPAYLVSMAICLALQQFRHHIQDWNGWQIPTHLLFIHNLFGFDLFYGINGVYWSLGVEMQFYVLYPLLLLGRQKWGLSRCLAVSLLLNVLCLAVLPLFNLAWDSAGRSALMTWCDWILGACLAEAHLKKKALFTHGNLAIFISFIIFVVAVQVNLLVSEMYFFASVLSATVMDRYLLARTPLTWIERGMIPVGIVSYSLYLWHLPVIYFAHDVIGKIWLSDTPWRFALVDLPATLMILGVISAASWYYVEVGVPRWMKKHKLTPHVARDLPEIATVTMP